VIKVSGVNAREEETERERIKQRVQQIKIPLATEQ